MTASVALYIAPDLQNYIHTGPLEWNEPGWSMTNSFNIGSAIEASSAQTLRQMFDEVTLVYDKAEADKYDLSFQPQFVSLRHVLERSSLMAGHPNVNFSFRMKVSQFGEVLADEEFKSPEIRGMDTAGWEGLDSAVAKATSDAIAEAMKLAATGITNNPNVKQALANFQPESAPTLTARKRTSATTSPPQPDFPLTPVKVRFAEGAPNPDDIAVIIGNADYGKLGKDIPNVDPAYADAASFKKYAMTALGVREGNIIDMRDATGAQMNRIFGSQTVHQGQLWDWIRKDRSNVYVYYAGHGAPGGRDGNAYLIPSDADSSRIEINGYPLDTLYSNLSRLPAKSVTVVLEACFSGSSQSGAVISNASPVYLKTKTPDIPDNITVISAGASDQMASWEEDGSHGLFTNYYLKGMSGEADEKPIGNGDGVVDYEELGNYLKETLTYYARRYYGRDQTAQIVSGK